MTDYFRPEFASETLPSYQGYHLQIFSAGRAKISLQTESNKKIEFFATRPIRDRPAYERQKKRSSPALPNHYAATDRLLAQFPDAKIYRLYKKGNSNETADNAHLFVSASQSALWLVMSGVVHRWEIAAFLIFALLNGKGARSGQPSLFNEYVPSYEHDWEDAHFTPEHYKVGSRLTDANMTGIPQPGMEEQHKPVRSKPARAPTRSPAKLDYDPWEGPLEDPIFLVEPPEELICEDFEIVANEHPIATKSFGQSTLYSATDLKKLMLAEHRQRHSEH